VGKCDFDDNGILEMDCGQERKGMEWKGKNTYVLMIPH
jgi:hypothetical protein